MKEYKGRLIAHNVRVGIVASRFNECITKNLFSGALEAFSRCGLSEDSIITAWVPGSYEVPLAAKCMAMHAGVDAVVCLGAVIRGETAHFEYIAGQVSSGIAQIALDMQIPIIFGILTTHTIEQAIERSGSKAGNKGEEAAYTALEMIDLLRQMKGCSIRSS